MYSSKTTEVIIVSDTHGKTHYLDEIEKLYPHADLYVHCGDLEDNPGKYPKWLFVRGNNDWMGGMPENRIVTLMGHKILILHSHQVSYSKRESQLAAIAQDNGCDIVLYGHTHVSKIQRVNGVLLINPGSMWMSRDGRLPSFARLLLTEDGQTEAEIIFKDQWPFAEKKKESKKRWFW
ncbi:MAG: metallophosphoesterase [Erysipelotrichaceae bacterium]|nr:metallophosphoesterase [Erysipelotrichaceae bacterium]